MKNIAIIGAGPAGIEAASVLARQHQVTLFEREEKPLCNIRDKAFLFPDFSSADELADKLEAKLQNENITFKPSCAVTAMNRTGEQWTLTLADGTTDTFDAVLLTTGYRVFDAHQKEELGYGIPVLTYEELTGLLLGYDPWVMGMQLHQVQCERLLDKIGIAYNPDDKYRGASGKIVRAPEKPEVLKV